MKHKRFPEKSRIPFMILPLAFMIIKIILFVSLVYLLIIIGIAVVEGEGLKSFLEYIWNGSQ